MTHETVPFEEAIEYLRQTPYLQSLLAELESRREVALGQLRNSVEPNEVFSCVGRIDALDDLVSILRET